MSNFSVSIRAEALMARLKDGKVKLHANMLRTVTRLSIEVQAAVKAEKLTGQVLHVRTGTLRRSINRQVTDDERGIMATVGTNVRYAAVHEYGFRGAVSIREYIRRVPSRDTWGFIATSQTKKLTRVKWMKTSEGFARVRAHTRNMNMPERSFLRSTLKDFRQRIRVAIKRAALESLR